MTHPEKARPLPELGEHEYALLDNEYTRVRQCCLCGEEYRELQNMGRLCCRVHPGMPRLNQYGQYSYSCCGRGCYESDPISQGCLRCDHMDRQPCTQPGHEDTRCADLAAFYVRAIPSVLFNYGMTRPLNEAVLARQPAGTTPDDARPIKYTMPFCIVNNEGNTTTNGTPLTMGSVARNLSAAVDSSPLMTHVYGIDDQGAEYRKMMQEINDRWPDTCIKKEDKPSESATGGGGGGSSSTVIDTASKISPSVPYIIPFVVICRIKI